MNKLVLLTVLISLFSCGAKTGDGTQSEVADTLALEVTDQEAITPIVDPDTLVLYESRLSSLDLPFPRKEMLDDLKKVFGKYIVTKAMGEQDGPNYLYYGVTDKGGSAVCYFAMDPEDSLTLEVFSTEQPFIKDQYGLKVGDGYKKIKALRKGVKTSTDLHQHTYAYFEDSNVRYEIFGDVTIPDTADFDNLHFTEDQIKDWTIERLIWMKRN